MITPPALQHVNQTKNNIYACLKNIKVSFISHLLTKIIVCFKKLNYRLFANYLRAQYMQEAHYLGEKMMIIIMEHKPKTIYISADNKRHAICEACKVRKTILAIYFYYLQKYDPSYNIYV